MWGPVMLLTVVATGNHFVFDAITGVAITAAGYGVHRLIAAGRPARRPVDAYALGACRPDGAGHGAGVARGAGAGARGAAATIGDMSLAERLVALEHEGWGALVAGEGGRYYGEHLTDDALMAFPFGVLTREATIEAMEAAPPWARYEIADPRSWR